MTVCFSFRDPNARSLSRIQEHLGKNQTKEATTTDARHPQLPHLHITGRRLVAPMRPQLQHNKEIRGHSVPAAKQNQNHGHIWAVPHGRQPVQCPQTSRAKGLESGPPEEAPATTKAQQTNLCAAVDASQLHGKFEDFPQTGNQQAQRPYHPIFHALHAAGVYKTPNHERHHPQLEGSTSSMAREKFPHSLHDGHIAIELCKVAPDVPCLEFSGKSNVLPDQKTLAVQLRKAIQGWHRSNGLPVPRDVDTEMTTFIRQQLAQHQQHATHTLNIHMLKALQERLPAGIIHCEDHFADRLIWYCPQLYHKCITGTFMKAEVFQTPNIGTPAPAAARGNTSAGC